MQPNPLEEWQRLATLYREMGDIEIRELAASIGDLTDTAQQVLREELKNRGLPETPPPIRNVVSSNYPNDLQWDSADDAPEQADLDDGEGSHEYTWKTPLCDCDTSKEAWRLVLALRQAGIDSWVERPQSAPRVTVAADQLESARVIAAQPISRDIVDEINEEVPVYQPPTCPRCGAADPTLESAALTNLWHCESCGNDWAEDVEDANPNPKLST
jgi:hypothetical protein